MPLLHHFSFNKNTHTGVWKSSTSTAKDPTSGEIDIELDSDLEESTPSRSPEVPMSYLDTPGNVPDNDLMDDDLDTGDLDTDDSTGSDSDVRLVHRGVKRCWLGGSR